MKNRITKWMALVAILCVLATVFAVPLASAASYSKVYGQTQDKVRVRESASTNATIIDNVIKGACVYVTSSRESGSNTFIKVNYRAEDGDIESGWICQSDGEDTYVKILSAAQAQSEFAVSGGNLPSKRVGTFTDSQRNATSSNSDNTYIREGSTGSTVKSIQTKLKAMGIYSGSITGNAGEKTIAAIKSFQAKYGLTADGIAGPQTIAKIDAVYEEKGGSSSSSSSSSSSASGLKLGSSGADVRDLQTNLTTLGYYWAEITGNFGSKTEDAVIRFQKAKGLTADGVAGSKTIAAINSAVAGKGGAVSSSSSSKTLQLNSQGDAVSQLQTDLKALGYYYAEITGNFGSKTEAAVKEFQKKNDLTADGVAGAKTLDAIAKALGSSGSSSSSSSGLKLGSTGAQVRALQEDLTTLGYYYGDITGHYGNMTKSAVTKFQKSRGLTQDGVAGATTIAAIKSALNGAGALAGGGSSSSGSSLKEGDSGSAVLDLQTRLKTLNYYYGELTGNYGSLTKKAVRSFQDDNDLTVDGIAGTKTLNKLYSLTGGGTVSGGGSSGAVVKDEDSYGRINKDNVNLRSSYSTSSAAKLSLDEGELVRITKVYTISGVKWYYITVKAGSYTYKGYVRSDNGGGDIDTGDAEILGMIRITADKVNMRKEPDSDSDSVGYAYTGDVFYYIATENGWFQTKNGYWISRDYAKVMTDDEVDDYVGDGSDSGDGSYSEGDTGSMVKWIQTALKELDYYNGELTGHYGSKTKEAVRQFQRDHGLSADGVAGPKTIAKLQEEYGDALNGGGSGGSASGDYLKTIYNVSWFTHLNCFYTNSNYMGLRRSNTVTLTDVDTGRSFKVKIQSVGNHADVEPATSGDTAVLCSLYGVSSASQLESKNKYQRRAMVVTSANGKYQAIGSIYAIPHGNDTVSGNNFDGQFCLHFKNSKTHGTDTVDTDEKGHQAMISAAQSYLDGRKNDDGDEITVKTSCPN